ncbi:hypothetical protein LAZ67_13000543, partial [Cordylochernes scorpioides]
MLQWPPILAKVQPHQRVQVTKRGSGIKLKKTCIDKDKVYAKFDHLECLHNELVALNDQYQLILLSQEDISDEEIDREFENCEIYIQERFNIEYKISVLRKQEKDALSTNGKNEVESKEANITKDKEAIDTADHETEMADAKNTLTKDEETKVSKASDEYTLEMDFNKEELEQEETANEKCEDADLKNKEDSEAESKGDRIRDSEAETKDNGVKDSKTAIKGYESVNNSRAVAEGADQMKNIVQSKNLEEEKKLDVEQGMDSKSTEEVKQIDVEQGTDSKVEEKLDVEQGTDSKVEEKITDPKDWLNEGLVDRVNENPPEVKGYYLPHRPVFKCESKTTPIRPVFDDASCRGHNGLSLKRDDCVASLEAKQEVEEFLRSATEIIERAKMNLRGWECSFDDTSREEPLTNVLGIVWNKREDILKCEFPEKVSLPSRLTKRIVLSVVQRIFDPLGFYAPVLVAPKLLLQRSWDLKIGWDASLPESMAREFKTWCEQMKFIDLIGIPRYT